MDTETILKFMNLGISVYGIGSQEVRQLRAQANQSDDQLLAAAEQIDQVTRDRVAAHLAAVAAEAPK